MRANREEEKATRAKLRAGKATPKNEESSERQPESEAGHLAKMQEGLKHWSSGEEATRAGKGAEWPHGLAKEWGGHVWRRSHKGQPRGATATKAAKGAKIATRTNQEDGERHEDGARTRKAMRATQ